MSGSVNRRGFLRFMTFSGVFSLFEKTKAYGARRLFPYLIPPENITPGISTWYATVCRECPAGCGMHIRNREGRAVKAEGNPKHPVNAGALCALGQASLQGLYNPDRYREPLLKDVSRGRFETRPYFRPITWEEAEKVLMEKLSVLRNGAGKGRAVILTPLINGSLSRLVSEWLEDYGPGKHYNYEPFGHEALRMANGLTFGREEVPRYRIEKAEVLLSFGAEFIDSYVSPVEYSRAFGRMHAFRAGSVRPFVSVEPRLSLTAANADEWLSIRPGTEAAVAMGMLKVILNEVGAGLKPASTSLLEEEVELLKTLALDFPLERVESLSGIKGDTIVRVARLFAGAKPGLALGPSVTAAGKAGLDAAVGANLLNFVCGNVGKTVVFGQGMALSRVARYERILELVRSMEEGEVGLLLLNNVNPAYSLPPGARFREAMGKVPFKVALSSFQDETSLLADMVLPSTTPLEEWGDYSPRKGIVGLMQPVMKPVFQAKSLGDLLLSLSGRNVERAAGRFPWKSYHEYLKGYWKELQEDFGERGDFRSFWEASLRRGGVWREVQGERVFLSRGLLEYRLGGGAIDGGDAYYLITYPGTALDGRGANKPWLQELPDPLHNMVWDTCVEVNPQTARALKIRNGDVVALEASAGRVVAPALLYEGVPEEALAVPLGQGHVAFGRYASGVGTNPVALLPGEADEVTGGLRWSVGGVKLTKTGKRRRLAITSGNTRQYGREVAQAVVLAGFKLMHEGRKHEHVSLPGRTGFYKLHPHVGHRWGMVIDLQKCTGCGACVAACYAENNVGVVGGKLIMNGREMAWISVQTYAGEDGGNWRDVRFIPMLCQQCDSAPCETVCPTYAAYHTSEGLNAQVYNRCVGTRYCANNCPYKVRRFNWFTWEWPEPLNYQLNPDVTVRTKGVMEKCTFCIQRIVEGKNRAMDEGRRLRDGEITPACVQTCPTGAIVFGDLMDGESVVSRLSKDERGYNVLEELNTAPAVTYLKKVLVREEAG